MKNNSRVISYKNSISLLSFLMDQNYVYEFSFKRNHFVLLNESSEKVIQFNYPLIINLSEDIIKDKNFLNVYRFSIPDFAIMLIQSGNAAFGLYKEGELLYHKVIRKYMTRQKQGKSQLKYLKTKGKSRAGSRVRLANAFSFFEEINQKMKDWIDVEKTGTIIYSCSPMLWGMLFQSKTKPPFDKKSSKLKKIPINTGIPNLSVLQKTGDFSQHGFLEIFAVCPADLAEKVEEFVHSPSV